MTGSDHPKIRISTDFAEAGLAVRLGCLAAGVTVRDDDPSTKQALADIAVRVEADLSGATVGQLPAIAEVRQAFRALGKDPSRYRPSSEALLNRALKGKPLPAGAPGGRSRG